MELVTYPVSIPKSTENEPVLLMPVGDIQYAGNDKYIAMKMLKKHIQWGVDHNVLFLGMGDYIDMLSPSNRARARAAALYDTALDVLDQKALDLLGELYDKALAPSKGRWLGLLEGHHYWQDQDGLTSDQHLAAMLGTKFLGTNANVRLRFNNGTRRGDINIWAHHGVGTGSTAASVLNRLSRISQGFEADIYLMGHLHRKVGEPLDYIVPEYPARGGEPFLVHRTRIMACTGSFLKGYMVGHKAGRVPRGTYVEQGMMNPVALGGVLVKITPEWKRTPIGNIWLPGLRIEQ